MQENIGITLCTYVSAVNSNGNNYTVQIKFFCSFSSAALLTDMTRRGGAMHFSRSSNVGLSQKPFCSTNLSTPGDLGFIWLQTLV